jgi:hypothetical protein
MLIISRHAQNSTAPSYASFVPKPIYINGLSTPPCADLNTRDPEIPHHPHDLHPREPYIYCGGALLCFPC